MTIRLKIKGLVTRLIESGLFEYKGVSENGV